MSDEKAPQKENTSPENDAIEKAMVEESEKKSETPRTDSDTDTSENLVEDALVETSEKNAEASKNTSEKKKGRR